VTALLSARLPVRSVLPRRVRAVLWGDRARWGLVADSGDPMWREWTERYGAFYDQNQRQGIGRVVNGAGHTVMRKVDLSDLVVLEVGPGTIGHLPHWRGRPCVVHLVDVDARMAQRGADVLAEHGIAHATHILGGDRRIPLDDASVDVIITFYSLEHIHPLEPYLRELDRVLAPGGVVIGAIPAEGGLAWGLGRFLTSRRWLRRNTTIDPDKLICWEHPNFADRVLRAIAGQFDLERTESWPLRLLPVLDVNLVVRFLARKRAS
jgi:SAM-dependent methyltransferase